MRLRERFGRAVRRAREAGDWTQEKLAARVGISTRQLGSIEAGANTTLDTAEAIAGALGVDVLVLLRRPRGGR